MSRVTKYKKLLFAKGIDQAKVADTTGLTRPHINLIANGYAPGMTMKVLRKLVIFHRCSPNDILDWEQWIEEEKAKKKALKDQSQKE